MLVASSFKETIHSFTIATFLHRKKIVGNTLLLILEISLWLLDVHSFICSSIFFFSQVLTMYHMPIPGLLSIFFKS